MVPPQKNLPLCMFYWHLHLWFDYVKKKTKNLEKTKKQYSRTLAKAKIQKTSRKPKTPKKSKKTIFQDSCKSRNAKIQKTSRKPKKTKKTIFQKSGDRVNRQESWNIVFLFFSFVLVFSSFFGFLHFYFCKSPGILFFFYFLFFFGFLEVFWIFAFARVLEYCVFFVFWFSRGFLNCFLLFKTFWC